MTAQEVVAAPEAALPPALRRQVVALQEQAWPSSDAGAVDPLGLSHDPALEPLTMVLVEEGRVLAALDILSKELVHAGERYRARGLSTVVTGRTRQRQGLGRTLVAAARDAIVASGADLALFTCDRPLAPFYEGAGFPVLPGAVVIGGTPEDPFPSDQFDKVTLAAFLSDRAREHAAEFRGARIALYPGAIDRLW